VQRPGEEAPRGRQVTPRRQQNIDDLAMLAGRPVQLSPLAGHLDVRVIDEPRIAKSVPARPGSSMNSGVKRCTHR